MRMGVIEGLLLIDNLKLGRDDGTEMLQMKSLLRRLGELGVPLVCYNFMAGTDWIRTSVDAPERGGAKVTAFDIAELATAPSRTGTLPPTSNPAQRASSCGSTSRRSSTSCPHRRGRGGAGDAPRRPAAAVAARQRSDHALRRGLRAARRLAPSP